ncbi:SDR family NAD(P)-dependent oxidoreductase [Bacillus benzoevorans]|uniref:NAD(P)-dependent dehydrogenase (Short-subunit alcohol dehydrogenase family) n=1 Tax=Bacillus benzoevorans TaxID=1456 RepID=A0A7X0LWA3_9BACI|nr:SDR family NAD(P)-dependent oxidoreductase [Bacillus benzoevorans]MBB6445317.1 NAD(P)-dependent dehydrogenase (short-subunit alcohol dehydrogenase family) [Bacillus benzoevorans]
MKLNLTGKNAIVTGGSAGIGLACAKALVLEGANVIIVGRDKTRLEKAEHELKHIAGKNQPVLSISEDLTDSTAAERITMIAKEQFSGIDILINNAGSARAGSFWELSDQDFIDAWSLKLLGYIRMVKAIGTVMINQRSGRILNIIGTGGKNPSATFLPGGTANAALINFTKGISKELAQYGVRINAISPALTATERAVSLAGQRAEVKGISIEEQMDLEHSSIPLGSMIQPEEIASMALLLVSDVIPSITGSEIIIDAGMTNGL